MNIKKQLLITVLIVASGSLWAMDENDPHRKGVFSNHEELASFNYFVKTGDRLTVDEMKEILEKYPHFYSWATPDGKTPLYFFINAPYFEPDEPDDEPNVELLEFMLQNGADPYVTTNQGETVFDLAKRVKKEKMRQVLLDFAKELL